MNRTSLTLAVGLAVPAQAHAEPPTDAVHGPGFVTMDRFDAVSRLGAELSCLFLFGSPTFVRSDIHVQYIDPKNGIGTYASLPISYGRANSGDLAVGMGDIEVGGISAPHLPNENIGVVFHAGITLPTGSTSDSGAYTNLGASAARLDDRYLAIPSATSLRAGASLLLRSAPLFARVDVAVDANLSGETSTSTAPRVNDQTSIRLNAGAGLDFQYASVTAEFVNLHAFGAAGWLDTGAVAVRFKAGPVEPYAAVVFSTHPFDVSAGAVTVGLDAPFR